MATHGLIMLPERIYLRLLDTSSLALSNPPEMTRPIKASGSCLMMTGKWWPRRNKRFVCISLDRPGLSVPALISPCFIRKVAILASIASSRIRTVTTQLCRDRLTIPINTSLTITHFKMLRRKMMIHWKIQNWHILRRINTESTGNYGCQTSGMSNTVQPGTLTSVDPNRLFSFSWTWRPKKMVILWQMTVLTQMLYLLEIFCWSFAYQKKVHLGWI